MTLAEREERIMRAEECVRAHGDREALALFRIMRETGIRMNELLDLVPENMNGRELLVVESKYKEKSAPRSKRRIKIPDACAALGVECLNPFMMLRQRGMSLAL